MFFLFINFKIINFDLNLKPFKKSKVFTTDIVKVTFQIKKAQIEVINHFFKTFFLNVTEETKKCILKNFF